MGRGEIVKKIFSGFLAVFYVLALTGIIYAQEITIQVPQVVKMAANAPIRVYAEIKSTSPITLAYMFYRIRGAAAYESRAMDVTGKDIHQATIPGTVVTPAGVEFYIQATNAMGITAFAPGPSASSPPFLIPVEADNRPPSLQTYTPRPGEVTTDLRPRITISLTEDEAFVYAGIDLESITLGLDGKEVKPKILIDRADSWKRISRLTISYTPESNLQAGDHLVTLIVRDTSGNAPPLLSWGFTVVSEKEKKEVRSWWKISGSSYGNFSSTLGGGNISLSERGANSSASLTMNFKGKSEDDTEFDGQINTNLLTRFASNDLGRKNFDWQLGRYYFTAKKRQHEMTFGNRYSYFPNLIVSYSDFRGLTYEFNENPTYSGKGGWHYFLVIEPNHAPQSQFMAYPLSSSIQEQGRFGTQLQWRSDRTEIGLNYLRTEDKAHDWRSGVSPSMSSDIVALAGKQTFRKKRDLNFLYSFARSFEDYGVDSGNDPRIGPLQEKENSAFNLNLSGYVANKVSLYLDYKYVEPYFGLLSTFGQDRRDLNGTATYYFDSHYDVGINYTLGMNNLFGQLLARNTSRSEGMTINLFRSMKFPSVTISGTSRRDFNDFPPSDPMGRKSDIKTDTLNVNSSYYSQRLSGNAYYSKSASRDLARHLSDYDNTSYNVGLTYNPTSRLTLRTNYSRYESLYRSTNLFQFSENPQFGVVYYFIPNILNGTLSYSTYNTKNSNNTTNTQQKTYALLFSLSPRIPGSLFSSARFDLGVDLVSYNDFIRLNQDYNKTVYRFNYNLYW